MTKIKEEDLTLLPLYLNSWGDDPKRKYSEEPVLRSWKNISFEILDKLNKEGLITDSKGKGPLLFTNEGIKRAEELKNKFLES